MPNNIEIPVTGIQWSIETKIINALVNRLGGSVSLTSFELNCVDHLNQGVLIIQTEKGFDIATFDNRQEFN